MTILELMQRTGQKDVGLFLSDLKACLYEVESLIDENVLQSSTDVVTGKRFYTFPPNASGGNFRSLYISYEGEDGEKRYRKIPRLSTVDRVDEDGT